ncbi:MAG: hypothetical protein HYR62_09235 [Actinobacteria bacterium]|nr:hypothetical protein [Actinomycetota bacterium]MBI3688065.1 hypothetical protein [Actinomycetota bacterium]
MSARYAVLAAAQDAGTTGMPVSFAILAAIVGTYLLSLYLHPYSKCKTCNGTGKHAGAMFGYAFRACRSCGGSSRRLRLGAKFLGINRK